jgi:hypothetical protein
MGAFFTGVRPGPIIVSCLVVVGFIGTVTLLLVKPIALDDHATSILTLLIGSLANEFGHVVQFHIGSSSGSKDKDAVIAANANSDTPAKGT